jgi:hypothetical protein
VTGTESSPSFPCPGGSPDPFIPPFCTGSEPKPYAQPLDSAAAASTTKGSCGPRKPENPDFFSTVEDEQAGIRWVRWAGDDIHAGSNYTLFSAKVCLVLERHYFTEPTWAWLGMRS